MPNQTPHLLLKGIVILFLLMIGQPAGTEDICFSVKSAQSGQLEGEVTQAGLEGKFQAIKYEYELMIPQAAASSQASLSGKRIHGPVKLTRKIGKGSALFFNALLVNDVLTVTIDFFVPSRSGKMVTFHKVSP
jgi:type VI secretion system Hcp family effector